MLSSKAEAEVVVSVHGSQMTGLHSPRKTSHCWASSLLFLQEENATVTSGGREDGATMWEPCGVSAQTVSMSQVSSRCMFWPPQRWFCRTHADTHSYIDMNISPELMQTAPEVSQFCFCSAAMSWILWAANSSTESHFSIQPGSHGYVLKHQIICSAMTVSVFSHSSEKAVTRVIFGRGGCSSWLWNTFRIDFLVGSGDNWNVRKHVRKVDTKHIFKYWCLL